MGPLSGASLLRGTHGKESTGKLQYFYYPRLEMYSFQNNIEGRISLIPMKFRFRSCFRPLTELMVADVALFIHFLVNYDIEASR